MTLAPAVPAEPRKSRRSTWRQFGRNRLAVCGVVLVLAPALLGLLAPVLPLLQPEQVDTPRRLLAPLVDQARPLGTDDLGRDMLSRLIWGSRISIATGLLTALGSLVAGVILGLVAGYFGGWYDQVIMRLTDVLMAFPTLLLALAIVAGLGSGLANAMLAIAIVGTPVYVRLVRSVVLSLREREFVQAARCLGASNTRIIVRHVLSGCVAPIIVIATLDVGVKINATAALSFLGLGTQPPTPDWGNMLASGRNFVSLAPHVATLPGIAIFMVVLGTNLLGDGLRDMLDPRR